MPDTFYVRTNDRKHYVEAKFLTDLQGNPIVSRNPVQNTWNLFDADHNPIGTNTNGYVIVPADFDIKKAIDFGRSISELMKASADNPESEGPIGFFRGKAMGFRFAPIFQARTPSDGDSDRRSALDNLIWNGLGSRAFSSDAD